MCVWMDGWGAVHQLAGMINVVVANPLWVVATRMKQGQQSFAVADAKAAANADGAAAAEAGASEGGAAAKGGGVAEDGAASEAKPAEAKPAEAKPKADAKPEAPVGVLGMVRLMLALRRKEGVGALWTGTGAGLVSKGSTFIVRGPLPLTALTALAF